VGVEVALGILIVAFVALLVRTFRVIPQARVGVIQRLGSYNRAAESGLTVVLPFIDKMLPLLDMREQVISFAPQPVITSDNVTINVTSVIYYQILDAKNATYQVANLLMAMEQIAQTTLRNVMGGLSLDLSLTSRDEVNARLRLVLDEVTERWGVRVTRVELKDISPPKDIQLAMEKQMQAERSKRATILMAEGEAQSAVLRADGAKQALVITSAGERQAAILRAEGDATALVTMQQAQAEAVRLVFEAVNSSGATPEALQFQYLQMLPKLAENPANKIIVVPADMAGLAGLATTLGQVMSNDRLAAARPPTARSAMPAGNGSQESRPRIDAGGRP
jgi:regulator of protease activity HflC (stomatin/prohibitin superfamily)